MESVLLQKLMLGAAFGAAVSTVFTIDPTTSQTGRRPNVILINLVIFEKGILATFLYFVIMVAIGTGVGVLIGEPDTVRQAVIAGLAWSSLVPAPASTFIHFVQKGGVSKKQSAPRSGRGVAHKGDRPATDGEIHEPQQTGDMPEDQNDASSDEQNGGNS